MDFPPIYSENSGLSVEKQMRIVLDSLPDSWEHERKTFIESIRDLTYENIVIELNRELEHRIQSSIRRSGRLMNLFSCMNKMSRTLT